MLHRKNIPLVILRSVRRIVFGFILLLARTASSQTTETVAEAGTKTEFASNVFGVGVNASVCTGMGLSFREHFGQSPLAYQISGGIWKSSGTTIGDIGGEFQYDLSVASSRLYALAGGGYYPVNFNSSSTGGATRFGGGVGYEGQLSRSVGVYCNLMITFFEPSGDILPLPSAGILVYFR